MIKRICVVFLAFFLVSTAMAFEFCSDGQIGERNSRVVSVDDMLDGNSQEWKWKNNQEVEIEVRVENREEDSKDYVAEIVFLKDDSEVKITEDDENLKQDFSLAGNERKSLSFKFKTENDLDEGSYNIYVKLYKDSAEETECVENSEEEFEIQKIEICSGEEVDEDKLEIKEIKDETEDAETSWVWYKGNEIVTTVEVENKDYSGRDFVVELVFLDDEGNEVKIADDDETVVIEESIDEGSSTEMTFTFELKEDVEEGDYELYAKMYDAEDDDICTSLKAEGESNPVEVQVKLKENDVKISNVEGPTELREGDAVTFSIELKNLGLKDQEKVNVILYNSNLDIRDEIVVEDLKSGDSETVTFEFEVPEINESAKTKISFDAEFDYNKKKDIYKESLENEVSRPIELIKSAVVEAPVVEAPENPVVSPTVNESLENETVETVDNGSSENETRLLISPKAVQNVTGTGSIWAVAVVGVLAATGLFMFVRKKIKKRRENYEYIEPEFRTIRYSASLEQKEE